MASMKEGTGPNIEFELSIGDRRYALTWSATGDQRGDMRYVTCDADGQVVTDVGGIGAA